MENKKKEVTISDIPDILRSLMSEHMKIPKEKIGDNAHLIKDLGMNSLQSIQINIDIEGALGFEISDNDAEKLNTLDDIVKYLRKRMAEEKNKKRRL